jgi:protein ImuB
LARYAARPVLVAPAGHSASALRGLPLPALRLPADMLAALHVLGFERIADLLAQPRAPLTLRFGPQLGRRIDQALGALGEPIKPVRSDELVQVKRNFAEPISAAETIARYIGKLVVQLCAELEAKGLGAKRLDLICHRVDNNRQAVRVGTALPVRDVKRLTRLLTDKIETIEPGFGIEILTLTATLAEPLAEKQTLTIMVDDGVPDVSDLVDILINRVGERGLYRAAPVATEVPERSVCKIPPMAPETGATWPGHWPRPSRLLTPPEQIETMALLPDHPPVSFTWRGIRRRVRRADGPERVRGEWWRRDAELAAVRDYFRVEDESGERYWIFRSGDGEDPNTGSQRWFLHGMFGYRPFEDEPDPRPLPEGTIVAGAITDIFDALIVAIEDTRLEPDLDELLWSQVNVLHRHTERIERELDDNEQAQKRGQRDQDGSEVKSVELERLIAEGQTLIERRDAFELMRDQAADLYERRTRKSWRPRSGSMVNHRNLTAAMIDSRDFLQARKRAETEVLLPKGPKIAITGGLDFNDHRLIWAKLDQVHAKHPDMVLLHGGSPKGAELIASKWADNRKVPQIAFKPDWTKHAKAAPFKRNDQMLDVMPIGVLRFPGTGIQDNLADKARKLGIPVWKFGGA